MTDRVWRYEGYDPAQEQLREALCTLGNGYFATRGAFPECAADAVHYPATYAAGCYNRLTSTVALPRGRERGPGQPSELAVLPLPAPARRVVHAGQRSAPFPSALPRPPDRGP